MIGGVHPVRKDGETAGGGGEEVSAAGAGGGGTAAAGGGDGLVVGVLGSVLYRRVEIEEKERREKGDRKAWPRGKKCKQPRPTSRRRTKDVCGGLRRALGRGGGDGGAGAGIVMWKASK